MNKVFSQEVKDYAAALHRLTCHYNHTDACGWMYGEEARYWNYENAEKLVPQLKASSFSVAQLHSLADILHPNTKKW